jgi:hypothetical protein
VGRPSIVYQPREDASAESERMQLTAVYRFILDCHAKKTAARPAPEPDSCDDVKESSEHVATPNCNR